MPWINGRCRCLIVYSMDSKCRWWDADFQPCRVITLFSLATVLLWPCLNLSMCINGYRRWDASFLYLRFMWVPLLSPALSKQLSYRPLHCPLFCSYQYNWRQFLWYRQNLSKLFNAIYSAVCEESVGGFGPIRNLTKKNFEWMLKTWLYEQRSAKVYFWGFSTDM